MQSPTDEARTATDEPAVEIPLAEHQAELNAVDGRTERIDAWVDREWTDEQLAYAVPDWLRENYEGVVEGLGGDWEVFANTMEANARTTGQHGDAAVAAWARKRATEGAPAEGAPADPSTTPPKGRTAKNPGKSATA